MKQIFLGVFLLVLTTSHFSQAAITNISVSGHSRLDTSSGTPIIYGGITNSNGNCTAGTTCNSCKGALQACNEQEITASTQLTIVFTPTISGQALLTVGTAGAETVIVTGAGAVAGAQTSVTLPWSALCSNANVCGSGVGCTTACAAAFSKPFNLGVHGASGAFGVLGTGNESTTITIQLVRSFCGIAVPPGSGLAPVDAVNCVGAYGLYGFKVKPGDSKTYLRDLLSPTGFPNRSDTQFRAIRLYYKPGNCTNKATVRNDSPYKETAIKTNSPSDIQPASDRFDGFDNDVPMVFKIALVDMAGNIDYFFPDEACNNAVPDENASGNASVNGGVHWSVGLGNHVATPGEVVGLLTENKCFIATAAFGSPLAPQLKILRYFRDHTLAATAWGRKFIHYYYTYSPYLADRIAESEALKSVTRAALYPLLGLAWISNQVGFYPTIVGLVFLLGLCGLVFVQLNGARTQKRSQERRKTNHP